VKGSNDAPIGQRCRVRTERTELKARLLSDGRLSGRSEHGDRCLKPAKYCTSRSLQPRWFGHPVLNLCVGGSNRSFATNNVTTRDPEQFASNDVRWL